MTWKWLSGKSVSSQEQNLCLLLLRDVKRLKQTNKQKNIMRFILCLQRNSSFYLSLSEDIFFCLPQGDGKAVDGDLLPDANGKDPNPGGQTEGSKWQRPRLSRKSLMKCCLVKWIIASTTQQGPGSGTTQAVPPLQTHALNNKTSYWEQWESRTGLIQ